MKVSQIVSLQAGGPGSGCNPEAGKCGRPTGSGSSEGENAAHQLTETISSFAKALGEQSFYAKLLRNGHAGVVSEFSKREQEELKLLKSKNCKLGYCYMNSQTIASRNITNDKLKYIEGLVTVHGIPISHAWLEYNGKVFDPTVIEKGGFGNKGKTGAPLGEYYGVEIPKTMIPKHQLQVRRYAPLSETEGFHEKIFTK